MAKEVLMPKYGLTMTSGTIIKWLKDEGDDVSVNEPLLEIETEKITNTVDAAYSGVLLKQIGLEGEKYLVSQVIGYIGERGEDVSVLITAADKPDEDVPAIQRPAAEKTIPAAETTPRQADGRIKITPIARKMAAERGLDYGDILGTGPGGRIVKADILDFTSSDVPSPVPTDISNSISIPYVGMRKAIGINMKKSWTDCPMVTNQVMTDAGALVEFRKMVNESVAEKSIRVTYTDLLVKISALALESMPAINSTLIDEKEIKILHDINISVAVALENGLITPVVKHANQKSLISISQEIGSLASNARSGNLSSEELSGGTFTVSNLGAYDSVDLFTPIINPPQAAILGVGRITDSVVAYDGKITIRPVIGLSLTYDHRLIDGAKAAEFMALFIKLLNNPYRTLIK